MIFNVILLLATGFGIKMPSSGQYLQKIKNKNVGAYGTKNVKFMGSHLHSLTFRHRASCILGQTFHYSPENAFLYI